MDILSTLFSQQSRKIGLIIPDVVISEKHSDVLEITEHPTELGAPVADHAYKRPSELTMEVGFSGGGSLLDLLDTSSIGLSLGLSPRETYQSLLDLQAIRKRILETPGVNSIKSFDTSLNTSSRRVIFTATIDTIYGTTTVTSEA